jgi:hypothetical protein
LKYFYFQHASFLGHLFDALLRCGAHHWVVLPLLMALLTVLRP